MITLVMVGCADARDSERTLSESSKAAPAVQPAPREVDRSRARGGVVGKVAGIEPVLVERRFAFRRFNGELVAGNAGVRSSVDARGRVSVAPLVPPLAKQSPGVFVPKVPANLETVSALRGATPIDVSPERVDAAARASVEIRRAGMIERVRNSARRIEQSWTFEREPQGEGDLVLRVAVSGRTPGNVTERGIELTAPGAPTLRYSHATWVDADGRRTKLPVRAEQGQLVLSVPGQVLSSSRYPAVLDPWIGPGREADGATNDAVGVDVAGDGSGGYLAVYTNYSCTAACSYSVHGMHFRIDSATGAATPLDAAPFPIGTGSNGHVAFRGNRYLVVWQGSNSIAGATVSQAPSAAPLGPQRAISDEGAASKYQVSVAAGAGGFLVVWSDAREAATQLREIYGSFVTVGAGDVLAPSANVSISHDGSTATTQTNPNVASNGSQFLVAWEDAGLDNIYGNFTAINAGVPVPAATDITVSHGAGSEWKPSVGYAADAVLGNAYLVAWIDTRGANDAIYGNRITTAPSAVDNPLAWSSDGDIYPVELAAAIDGSSYMLAWSVDTCGEGCTDNLYAQWLGPGLLPLSPRHVITTTDEYPSSIASGAPGQFLVGIVDDSAGATVRPALALPNGSPCPAGPLAAGGVGTPGVTGPEDACLSNVCADGVCCNEVCNAAGPCQACAGANRYRPGTSFAAPNGTCGYFNTAAAVVCDATTSGACDVADICNGTGPGTSATSGCPSRIATAGVVCLSANGACDVADTCDGLSTNCTARFAPSTQVCRAGSGDECDPAELCTGTAAACPTDNVTAAASLCRPSINACDPAERCTGVAGQACPSNIVLACPDAGPDAEAGVPDAAPEAEAAAPDAAPEAEAAAPDAAPDVASEPLPEPQPEAGPDAGIDAGSDAGSGRAGKRHDEGCNCGVAGGRASSELGLSLGALGALALLYRRRRPPRIAECQVR
ncbi:MAG TPA: MYXO-CTERM sorting domain-containing protein [Polyangiaceae bacterium]